MEIGGAFLYHLLHCDSCGAEMAIPFEELGDVHKRYIKGLDVPYSSITQEGAREIQRNFEGEPLDREAYHAAVEKNVGLCDCGGRFTLRASPRCPERGSDKYERDPDGAMICID